MRGLDPAQRTACGFCRTRFPATLPPMFAVILAAGRGTRMGALTASTPKPLLPLQGRPIITHILDGLAGAGVTRAAVVTGYLGEQIEAHLGDGTAHGLHLVYRRQTTADGTARALTLVRDLVGDAPFVLSWGDVIVEPHVYRTVIDTFRAQPADLVLTVNPVDDPWRGGAVYVDDAWRVTRLVEKPPRGTSTTPWNNAGIFVFSPTIFPYVDRLAPSARGEYELPQAIAAMLADGRVVRAVPVRGFWSDLGTPDDLAAAQDRFVPRTTPADDDRTA